MKRLMKILPICAAALLFSAAAPGIAAADHGRRGGHGEGQHHVVKQHKYQKSAKHFDRRDYRRHDHRDRRGYGHGYGQRRHFRHGRRHFRQARRHHGYNRSYYVYVPYYGYRGYRH